ncbi:hypothetical protein F2Q68_00012387 [Brassica cretica]|uniref:Uncharacterized protein n=1 Tax=Brassica cretica TaxID=69181 RepID=A0A8S9KWA2_BRACR|nr:hypothetical protein F2Q68_00012387 [Brassica cretica]
MRKEAPLGSRRWERRTKKTDEDKVEEMENYSPSIVVVEESPKTAKFPKKILICFSLFVNFITGPQRAGPDGPSASPQEARIKPEMPGRLTWYADHLVVLPLGRENSVVGLTEPDGF